MSTVFTICGLCNTLWANEKHEACPNCGPPPPRVYMGVIGDGPTTGFYDDRFWPPASDHRKAAKGHREVSSKRAFREYMKKEGLEDRS